MLPADAASPAPLHLKKVMVYGSSSTSARILSGTKKVAKPATGKHPANAVLFQGHWYVVPSAKVPWTTAAQECQRAGGYLVCIETAAEALFVARLAGKYKVWLGGFRNARGQWMWVNGKPIKFANWATDQPGNAGGKENCLEFLPNGTWNDVRSTEQRGFICEWEK